MCLLRLAGAAIGGMSLAGFAPEREDVAGWSFVVSKDTAAGVETVTAPVRDGLTAIGFTLAPGNCAASDCGQDRERLELKQREYQREGERWWYGWSFRLAGDFPPIWPARVFLGQFHQENGPPALLFSLEPRGLVLESRFTAGRKPVLIPAEELPGRWHDIVMEVKWSRTKGHVLVKVDGEVRVDSGQPTLSADKVYFKFGIYRAHLDRVGGKVPVQRVTYDRLRRGKTEESVTR